MNNQESDHLSRMRQLIVFLFLSAILNVILICLIFYWVFREKPPTPYYELRPASQEEQQVPLVIDHSNADVIRHFKKMSMQQMVRRLWNTRLIENGYTERDLALACLVAFHYFDLERALIQYPHVIQKRTIVYGTYSDGRAAQLVVYPGLGNEHYQAIIAFANQEEWPLTSRGLYYTLRKSNPVERENSLKQAFFMTPEFLAVEMLFGRAEVPVDKNTLLNLILEGEWVTLARFFSQQKIVQDLSHAKRQHLLLEYIEQKSKTAAHLFLITDGALAFAKLDDRKVMSILQLLTDKTHEAEQFALALLTSSRSDAIWKMAAERLYLYAGEPMPDKYQHHAAIARFVPKYAEGQRLQGNKGGNVAPQTSNESPSTAAVTVKQGSSSMQSKPQLSGASQAMMLQSQPIVQSQPPTIKPHVPLYIVQEGDSLWKIARRFNVDVDHLKIYNGLDSDVLRPGMSLKIPQK